MIYNTVPIQWEEFKQWLLKQNDTRKIGFVSQSQLLSPNPLSTCAMDLLELDCLFGGGESGQCNYWNGFDRIIVPMPQQMRVFSINLVDTYEGPLQLTVEMVKKVINLD